METTVNGRCHCGNVSYALEWPTVLTKLPLRRCSCSFCTRHGCIWTSHPDATLVTAVREPERVSHYRQGTGTADFFVCRNCGVVCYSLCEIDGRLYSIVNARTLEGDALQTGRITSINFEGEELADRLARRTRNWIGRVESSDR